MNLLVLITNAPLFANWLSDLTLKITLAGGLVGLTIAFVMLSRTRWGQTSPMVKCVALAVYAHLLFLGFAYGTKMVFESPTRGRGDSILKLNLLDSGQSSGATATAENVKVWEKLPDSPVETPELLSIAPEKKDKPDPKLAENEAVAITKQNPPKEVAPIVEPERPKPPDLIAIEKKSELPPTPLVIDEAEPATKKAASAPPPEPPAASPPAPDPANSLASAPPPPSATTETPPPVHKRPADNEPVPALYQHRTAEERSRWALLFGGSQNTEAAVNSALVWLAANQSPDGRWDADAYGAGKETRVLGQDRGGAGANADTGVTGLALLAFLAAGETHLEGEHRENVQHGLEFLLRSQRADGYLAGQAEMFASMYCHGMATLALAEAYAMTGDQRIRPYLERAVQYTLESQNSTTGGWRYQPGDQGDMSQFGWQLMALKSAEKGGIAIPAKTREGMQKFLASVTSGTYRGLASYRVGERPSRTMTAEAMVCRFFQGEISDGAVKEGVGFVLQELPQGRTENLYYWYYGTLALFQVQGEAWKKWNVALQEQLLQRQRLDGKYAGSWDPDRVWGHYGGRIYSTAMGALCLEVYYRYLPLYGAEVQTARK